MSIDNKSGIQNYDNANFAIIKPKKFLRRLGNKFSNSNTNDDRPNQLGQDNLLKNSTWILINRFLKDFKSERIIQVKSHIPMNDRPSKKGIRNHSEIKLAGEPFGSIHSKSIAASYPDFNHSSKRSSLYSLGYDRDRLTLVKKKNRSILSIPRKKKSGQIDHQIEREDDSKIRIYKNSFSSSITNYFNAHGLTFGRNIFLGNNYRLDSPQGFALLVHELTHIKQLTNDRNLSIGGIYAMRRRFLEQEALENERKAFYDYSIYSNHLFFSNLLNAANNIVFSSIPLFSSGLKRNDEKVFLPNYSDKYNTTTSDYITTHDVNDVVFGKNFDIHTTNSRLYNKNSIKPLLSFGDFQSHGDNHNNAINDYKKQITSDMVYINDNHFVQNDKNSPNDMPTNILLAEKNRSAEWISQDNLRKNNTKSTLEPSTVTIQQNINIEQIAERVYDIIEKKLINQRNRRGIR